MADRRAQRAARREARDDKKTARYISMRLKAQAKDEGARARKNRSR